jgi:hypothetical protein
MTVCKRTEILDSPCFLHVKSVSTVDSCKLELLPQFWRIRGLLHEFYEIFYFTFDNVSLKVRFKFLTVKPVNGIKYSECFVMYFKI